MERQQQRTRQDMTIALGHLAGFRYRELEADEQQRTRQDMTMALGARPPSRISSQPMNCLPAASRKTPILCTTRRCGAGSAPTHADLH